MDLFYIIKSINDTESIEIKEELILDFISTVRNTQSVTIAKLSKVFQFLKSALNYEDKRLLSLTNLLLLDIIEFTGPDLEVNFPMITAEIIKNLGDPENEVRKLSLEVLRAFIRKTRNIELILESLVRVGVESPHFYIRERAVNVACDIFDCEKGIFSSKGGVNEARRYLESVIVSLFDKHRTVAEEAKKTIIKLSDKNYENFFNAFKRLSDEHQKCFKSVVEENANRLRSAKFFEINLDDMMRAAFPEDEEEEGNNSRGNEDEVI